MNANVIKADTGLFYCPLPTAVHPQVEAVAARSADWIARFALCPHERQRRRLLATNSAEFYGRITPDAPAERLQIAADWVYWAFAFDDLWSSASDASDRSGAITTLAARLVRLLETLDERLCAGDRYLLALHDIAVRYARCATPAQLRRWVEAHRQWLFGHIQRDELQAGGEIGLDAYLTMRLHDCGGPPVTAMIDVANGFEVPDPELDAPPVRALTEMTWLIAAIDNERVSRAKEVGGEDGVQNLVDVLMRRRGGSLEQALAEVVSIRDRLMTLFVRLHAQALPAAGPALRRYLTDLAYVVPGNVAWSLKTARYTTIYGTGSAQIGTVDLQGGWTAAPADELLEPLPIPAIAWWWRQLAAE